MPTILALPGSLRKDSSSNLVLQEIASHIPDHISFEIFDGIAGLPHFDDAMESEAVVNQFREKIRVADFVVICTPEYAFGIPGSLKNALDWTVGSGEFYQKRVALITASSSGERGHAALLLVLEALSATMVQEATVLISNVRSKFDSQGRIKEATFQDQIKQIAEAIEKSINDYPSPGIMP